MKNGTGNALVSAVAGSGKTTTIVNALDLIDQTQDIYFLAFNKAIAEEIRSRTPAYVNVSTIHSVGAKALLRSYGSKMNEKLVYQITNNFQPNWFANEPDLIDAEYLGTVRKLVDLARLNLCDSLPDVEAVAQEYGIPVVNGECEKAVQVLEVKNAFMDEHDFVDMLYRTAVDKTVKPPKADWILVDECQDLNRAQQEIVKKMMKPTTRVIFVGDPHQAIYGFAGADADSFNRLKSWPNMTEFPLSVNYRCGSSILDEVRAIVPGVEIEAAENAIPGELSYSDKVRSIADGDMVLCRNTVPLVKLCLEFIKDGRKAYVKGGDIGKQLAGMVMRSNAKTLDQFENWLQAELQTVYNRLKKSHPMMTSGEIMNEAAYSVLADKRNIFIAIIDSARLKTPAELIRWINDLFADNKAGVCFSTVHKSKGLENDRVFIIERQLMPSARARTPKQQEQEMNLIYVAYTRAKKYLGIVEDWHYKKR